MCDPCRKDKDKALFILQQLAGMTIADAQELLSWCSSYLLEQPVGEWKIRSEEDSDASSYTVQ